ncbi:sulfite exporter TauE/SafE family protein [Smaragdicoccus niigatensis]|uniref:sulfite exporter TauE/SafE family protein n=1 Tax=Smaragdicoccus niigatensis TaxID=359359 RepID=UPI0003A630BA|nr:sulfite exporter TauE/SafE family protein [Smaragdicoccus niigatensis]
MTVLEFAGLVLAGYGAGLIGFVAGMASLVSFPALLAAGLTPVAANATNTVALVAVGIGSTVRSGEELAGRGRELRTWIIVFAIGGGLGCALLLLSPPSSFDAAVPFLVALAGLALLLQPRLQRLHSSVHHERMTAIAMFLVAVYGGYFGAGAGVMFLALLLAARDESMHAASVLKSFLLGVANLTAAIAFCIFGPVHWWASLAVAIGAFLGGWTGPPVVKALPQDKLRIAIGIGAFGLAAWLFFR